MDAQDATRRKLILGGLAFGLALPACAQPPAEAGIRRDLYNGELHRQPVDQHA